MKPDMFPELERLSDIFRTYPDIQAVYLFGSAVTGTDNIVLKHEVVRHNRLIYQTEDFDRGAYFSRIVRQFLDFRPYLDVQRQAYKQRILHGQTRSHPQEAGETG